jgi:hypothetical protein
MDFELASEHDPTGDQLHTIEYRLAQTSHLCSKQSRLGM